MDRVREWQPGEVALVKWSRHPEGAVYIRTDHTSLGDIWWGATGWIGDATAKEVRPLVVIDPEDEDLPIAHALWERLVDLGTSDFRVWRHHIREVLNGLANPTPPIEEPTGLGAVVEDDDGDHWVNVGSSVNPWRYKGSPGVEWSELTVIRVLSEGVPAEADR